MNKSKTEHSVGASVRGSSSCEVFIALGKACSEQWDSLDFQETNLLAQNITNMWFLSLFKLLS